MNPTIVFLAAGMSTRYGGLKQLEPVGPGGETLLDYALFDAFRAGFSRVVLVIREELEGRFRDLVRDRWPREVEVLFHHQRLDDLPGAGEEARALLSPPGGRKKPWGTAHALLTARDVLPGPFALLNADDYYGPSAFTQAISLMGRDLRAEPGGVPGFGLVAYTLEETLSRHGGVSRGICAVDRRGWLEEVEEVLKIRKTGGAINGETLAGEGVILTGREAISTNFWVFTPDLFPYLEEGFSAFLEEETARARTPSSAAPEREFLIPTQVNGLLARQSARVWVLRTQDPFFGITHPEDWEWVAGGLRDLIREGRYPDPLWGDDRTKA